MIRADLRDRSSAKGLVAALAIVATAAFLTLPAALQSPRLNDSFWIDWVWLDQFARQLGQGQLYPRWLELSHGGLGSPVFYYYPPIAFYVGSMFALAGLSIYASIIATFGFGYVLSGAAMYMWLKDQSRAPLLGAMIFMLAPYHAFNFYSRGALAEFLATALLPLVMLGLRKLSQKRVGGFALVSVSYAALIATHLPLALLASLFLFAPYALITNRGARDRLLPSALALMTGIALAATFLLPALLLEAARDTAKLWQNASLQPWNWSLWNDQFRQSHVFQAILLVIASLEIPLVVLIVRDRSRWAMYGAACGLVAAGIVPALWALPLLSSVQFPFRLLPIAEFALATAIALATWRLVPLLVLSIPPLVVTFLIVSSAPGSEGVSMAAARTVHPDVPENLPPGERPYSWPSRWALGVASAHRVPTFENGVTVDPVFYFPAWQVRCDGQRVRAFPALATGLLAYDGRNCVRHLGKTGPERAGAFISLLALLFILLSPLHRRVAARNDVRQEVKE